MTASACSQRTLAKLATLGLASLLTLAVSCADPDGEFQDFVERATQIEQSDAGMDVEQDVGNEGGEASACTPLTQADVANGYMFTLAAVILPSKPFVADATLTIDEANNTVSMSVQPLSAADKTTPVGSPILGGPFQIEADGSFEADFGVITMTGAANPISGSDLVTELRLSAAPGGWCQESSFVCGAAEGIASKPIENLNLKGSTFTFQKLSAPGQYPAPVTNCAGKP